MADIAVLLPGTGYTTQRPLLHWAGALLRERGWEVREVAWTVPEAAFEHPGAFVDRYLTEAFDGASDRRLIVGKSFGCFGLPWTVREGLPGVWLTPVLVDEALRAALAAAPPQHLAIGGDEDALWTTEGLERTAGEILTVPRADHSLEIPGDWEASLAAQREALRRVAAFVDGL